MRRHVALKVLPLAGLLDAPKILRFQSEVRAVASLDHPNIVSVYSVGEERGTHFFAMQLIRGSSLSEVIRALRCMRDGEPRTQDATSEIANSIAAGGNFSVSATEDFDSEIESKLDKNETILENNSSTIPSRTRREYFGGIVSLMVQAAEALEHAHGRGIVHRDIKPANLLLDAQARLYVTDFGLAQIEADAGVTMTGDLLGTLRYMAPEQTLAKRVVIDHRADVYSLGATLYELLALQPAFPSSDRHELLKQVAFEEPKQLRRIDSTIPAELETIVQKAMSKDRDERYETSKAFGEDLTRYLEHRPILAHRPSVIQVISKWIGRNPTVTLSGVLALAFFAVLFGISSSLIAWQRERAEAQFQRARVIRLASESRALSTERPSLSMLFAIEAHQRSQREQVAEAYAHEALLNASHALPRTHTLKVGGPPVASVLMAKRWLVMLGEGRVRLLDLSSTSAPPIELCDAGVDSMVLSDDRRWLVTIGDVIQRWDLDSPKSSITVSVDPVVGDVRDAQPVSLSSDGGVLAIIEKDGTASIWDCTTAQPKRLRAITHPNEKIHFVNVSSDGSFVIAAAENSEPFALLWRLDDSNSEPRILDGHEGPVVDFRQPRNGREFATLDRKRMIVRDLSNLDAPAIRTVQFDGHYASDRILSTDFSKLFLREKFTSRLYGFDLSADDPKATVSQLKGHSVEWH